MHNYFFPKTAQGWDSLLTKEYDYGIWNFSYSVADMIIIKAHKYRYHPKTELPRILLTNRTEYLKDEIRIRENLKAYIIKNLYKSLIGIMWDKGKELTEWHYNYIIDVYDLEPFFKKLNFEIKSFESFLGKKGRPPESRYLIASIWAQVIKHNKRHNWHLIEHLLCWFFGKLIKTPYCKILGNEYTDFYHSKLSYKYYLKKRNEQHKKDIELLKEKYFPRFERSPVFRIEFKDDYIDFPLIKEKGPLLVFPDEETFP